MSSTTTFSVEQLLAQAGWARSLARQLVADAAAADDVVQEALVAAMRERPRADRPLRPWLERVVRNFATNVRRNRRTRELHERAAAELTSSAAGSATDEVVAKAEGQQRVVSAVLALDEPYRSVVLLRFFEGLSAAEIARRQLVPPGTVRWRLSAGLQQLRERFDGDANGDSHLWCASLIPLAGFRSIGELAAVVPFRAAHLSNAVARPGHSSWATGMTGVLAMKSAWMMSVVVAIVAAASFLLWSNQGGEAPDSNSLVAGAQPVVPQVGMPAAQVAAVEREEVEREAGRPAPSPASNDSDPKVAGSQSGWRASARVQFVDTQGAPVPGVRARFGRREVGVSDSQGQLQLPVPAPFAGRRRHTTGLDFAASHERFATVTRSIAVSELRGDGDQVEIGTIELEAGGSVEGTVLDASGQPAAGARVAVEGRSNGVARTSNVLAMMPVSQDRVGSASAETDASGHYRIEGILLGASKVSASFDPTAWWVDTVAAECSVQVVASVTARADLQLARRIPVDRVLTVKVVDPDNRPVQMAYLSGRSSGSHSTVHTDEHGVARIGFHRGGRVANLVVTAPEERFPRIVHDGAKLGSSITLQFAKPVSLPLTLTSSSERALEQVDITMRTVASGGFLGFGGKRPEELSRGAHDVSAEGGVVDGLWLPNERFGLEVRCAGHQIATFGPFDPGKAAAGLDLVLETCPVVAGRVLDLQGRVVANATVSLHRRPERRMNFNGFAVWLDPNAKESCQSDDDGRYALTLRGEQSFFVRAEVEGCAATLSAEQKVEGYLEGEPALDLVVHGGGTVTGHVFRADARSPAGSIVVAHRGDGFARTVRADAEGVYRFENLTPGAYEVKLTSEDLEPGSSRWNHSFGRAVRELESANCQVQVGKVTSFDIGPRYALDASLVGSIQVEGWLLAGKRVSVELAEVAEGQMSQGRWHAMIGKQGRFELPSLPSGRVQLELVDGTRRLVGQVHLVPGKNRYELDLKTRSVELRDLPVQSTDGVSVFVLARWSRGDTTIQQPVEVTEEGAAKVVLPFGKVCIERSPTPADAFELLARGEIGMIKLRDLVVE